MKTVLLLNPVTLAAAFFLTAASAQNVVQLAPESSGSTTIYRQVMPDGRIVYSDKPLKGTKLDRALTIDPLIKGNTWTSNAAQGPTNPPHSESTPVKRTASPQEPGRQRTRDDASSDVIKAEMLLEDAKKRQTAGAEPLPGERTGTASGKSRLNASYQARQDSLASDVARAEAALKQAVAERDRLR
ncbi:MAG: hypothetical protein JWQ23_2699 [Herminiimonas sp.]|nr:hypothetical protein [Herminiimonas sp.]